MSDQIAYASAVEGFRRAEMWLRLIESCLHEDRATAMPAIQRAQHLAERRFVAQHRRALNDAKCMESYKQFQRLEWEIIPEEEPSQRNHALLGFLKHAEEQTPGYWRNYWIREWLTDLLVIRETGYSIPEEQVLLGDAQWVCSLWMGRLHDRTPHPTSG